MNVTVYLPGGNCDTLYVPAGENVLDAIYEAFGCYAEYDIN